MLRIAGGRLKGITIKGGSRWIKPTSELVRLSIFNILGAQVEEAYILDLYAGSGALGIEALSRGASKVVFVDTKAESIKLIRENLTKTNLLPQGVTIRATLPREMDRLKALAPFDLIVMDPPYEKGYVEKTLSDIDSLSLLKDGGILTVEHSIREEAPAKIGFLVMVKSYSYGDTKISIFRKEVVVE